MKFLNIILFFCSIHILNVIAFYSINYYLPPTLLEESSSQQPLFSQNSLVFVEAPNSIQVADIYNRLSGLLPLLLEDKIGLPSSNPLVKSRSRPALLEVLGGVLPSNVTKIISSSAFNSKDTNPKLENILNILKERNGEEVKYSKTINLKDAVSAKTLQSWLNEQHSPVIILHHETPASQHYIKRSLLDSKQKQPKVIGGGSLSTTKSASSGSSSSNSTVTELSEFQISQYQICLWTGLGFLILLLISICSIIQMDVVPDTLLYAKFQSARTGKID